MKLELHHINFVAGDVDRLDRFYRDILQMEPIPVQRFPRTEATDETGYDGKIKFVTDGNLELHLAEQDFDVAARNNGARRLYARRGFAESSEWPSPRFVPTVFVRMTRNL